MAKTKQGKKKGNKSKKKASKGKQQQDKRQPYNAGSSNRRVVQPMKIMSNVMKTSKALHEAVCSVTDPFCYKARLAKWPDGQGGGTLAMQLRARESVTVFNAAAAGNFCQYTGDLPFNQLNTAAYAAGTYSLKATYDQSNFADFITYAGQYRIVTWGIVIRNVAPATTASGTIIIRKLSKQYPINSTPSKALMQGSEVQEFPVYPGMELSIVARTAGNTARSFVPQNTNTTIVNGSNWETIQVELLNSSVAATAIALDIEIVYNVEIQLAPSFASMHQFVPASAPQAPVILQASNAVMNKASTIVEGGMKAVGEHVLGKVEDFFSTAGTDLLAMLF